MTAGLTNQPSSKMTLSQLLHTEVILKREVSAGQRFSERLGQLELRRYKRPLLSSLLLNFLALLFIAVLSPSFPYFLSHSGLLSSFAECPDQHNCDVNDRILLCNKYCTSPSLQSPIRHLPSILWVSQVRVVIWLKFTTNRNFSPI
jgi:hypothetical protein